MEPPVADNAHLSILAHKYSQTTWNLSQEKILIGSHKMRYTCGREHLLWTNYSESTWQDYNDTHRICFSEDKWEDSALSMHTRTKHEEVFNLQNFTITLVKKCSLQTIRREEFRIIDKYRTKVSGINRYKN